MNNWHYFLTKVIPTYKSKQDFVWRTISIASQYLRFPSFIFQVCNMSMSLDLYDLECLVPLYFFYIIVWWYDVVNTNCYALISMLQVYSERRNDEPEIQFSKIKKSTSVSLFCLFAVMLGFVPSCVANTSMRKKRTSLQPRYFPFLSGVLIFELSPTLASNSRVSRDKYTEHDWESVYKLRAGMYVLVRWIKNDFTKNLSLSIKI